MDAPPRSATQRVTDTRRRLAEDVDCWVATSQAGSGGPHLVPLSFWWDGQDLWLGTGSTSATVRNALAHGRLRVALGLVRDVVIVDATVAGVPAADVDPDVGDAFAVKTGFDPRVLANPYTYLRLTPWRILAWREENELADRTILREGHWIGD